MTEVSHNKRETFWLICKVSVWSLILLGVGLLMTVITVAVRWALGG